MESHSKSYHFKQATILQLNDKQKAQRLWFLFNEKILDCFVKECYLLQKYGINLSAIGNLVCKSKDLKVEYQSMKRVYQIAMQDIDIAKSKSSDWKEIELDNDCKISIKTNGTMLTLKGTGVVNLNVKHLCYAAYLIKHYTQCIPFCIQAKDILQPSRVQKVAFLRLSIPVPFVKDRSCLVKGVGFRCSQKPGNIYIFAQGITNDKQYQKKVKVDSTEYMKGRQLFDLKHCAMEIKCFNQQLIEFSAAAIVDHHVPFVPDAIIMFAVKQFAKFIISNLLKKLKNFHQSIWGKQLKQNYNQNKQFYEWIDKIAADYFKGNK